MDAPPLRRRASLRASPSSLPRRSSSFGLTPAAETVGARGSSALVGSVAGVIRLQARQVLLQFSSMPVLAMP